MSSNSNENTTGLILYDVLLQDGESGEPEFDSAAEIRTEISAVRKALRELGYNVRTLGLRRITARVVSQIEELNPDFIFNLCESLYDQNQAEMYLAGLFELLRIPYTGSPPFTLGLALNKRRTKEVLRAAGIPVPRSTIAFDDGEEINLNLKNLEPPFIVKPLHEDGSAGITSDSVVTKEKDLLEQVKSIVKDYNQPAIVEEFLEGREFHVSILGYEEPRVLALTEIDFKKLPRREPPILTYKAKWDKKSLLYEEGFVCPAQIEPALQSRIERIALRAFKELGCRDYGRIDVRLDKNDRPYVLEVNANPDIDPASYFGDAARAAGMTYVDFIGEIVKNTLKRK